jgi:hypothetical protein
MKLTRLASAILLTFAVAGCGRKSGVDEAQKNVGDTEKQLQEAKAHPGAEQKVADLEKQLADAKKQLADAKVQTAAPAAPAPAPAEPPPPPKPKTYLIEAGTEIPVRTTTALSTKTATTGQPFEASLTRALTVDGVVLAPAGADVSGVVALSDPGGKVKGKALLRLALKSIKGVHGPIPVETNSQESIAKSNVKKDVGRGAIMSGAGAVIGAIAGGGKGAAIGAGIGAGAGVGTAMATKGAAAELPAETVLTFITKAPVTVTAKP